MTTADTAAPMPPPPAALSPDAVAAIVHTFGRAADHAVALEGGRSGTALAQVTVGERRYVVRQVQIESPIQDARRQFACMRAAADADIAPRLHHTDATTGIAIMDWIEPVPLGPRLRSGAVSVAALGELVARLHALPLFPPFVSILEAASLTLAGFVRAGQPPARAAELEAAIATIGRALAPHTAQRSCHKDLNPSNILFDGRRLWLVDFELASAGDSFFDLAGLGIFSPTIAAQADVLLAAYLGRAPSARDRAHLALARAASLVFYALMFRGLAARRGQPAATLDQAPDEDLAAVLARIDAKSSAAIDEPSFVGVLTAEALRACSGAAFTRALADLG